MKYYLALFFLFALVACAPTIWIKSGASSYQFEQDKLRCEYEAELGTPDSGYVPTSMGNAIGSGIGEGVGQSFRKIRLQHMCLAAKGWTPS